MKKPFIVYILGFTSMLFFSCAKDIPPVFEVYITLVNADNYDQIEISPFRIEYGILAKETNIPAGGGDLNCESRTLQISNSQFLKKVFVTSIAQQIGNVEYLSLDASLDFKKGEKNTLININKFNNIFSVDFDPSYGEAYELNFIVDIKESLVKKGTFYDFVLSGDSKVVITKY